MNVTFENNAVSIIANNIGPTDTIIQVRTGDGGMFPTPGAGEYFPATLVSASGREIVYVTSRSNDTLTVQRGMENTEPTGFVAGDIIEVRLTARVMNNIIESVKATQVVLDGLGSAAFESVGTEPEELPRNKDIPQPFPSGTRMLFQQSAAPTGWTKVTDHDNKALRVVSGNAGSGGRMPFTDAFSDRQITLTNLPDVTIQGTTSSDGQHSHELNIRNQGSGSDHRGTTPTPGQDSSVSGTYPVSSSGAHSHSFSASLGGGGQPIDFSVQYLDVIVAEKA